jgi:transposase-like protein
MVVRIAGNRIYLWRAVDNEGEVLDILVQRRRDKRATLRLMRKLLKKRGFTPKLMTTDKLDSYGSAFRHLHLTCPHEQGQRSRVDDWRGSLRFARLYCFRQLSPVPVSQFAP